MQTRTTLSEMSKVLNLSISTVSKSLSGSSEISAITQKRVRDFAKKCNYVPNHFAASFRRGNTNTIGLVIPNILNPFYAKILHSIESYLDKKGYKLITSFSNECKNKETASLTKMLSGYVDGIIMCISKEALINNDYSHIKSLVKLGTPIVMFDRICDSIECDKVITNDYEATYEATKHLIKTKNCKNILMVSLINDMHHGKLRAKGFKDAILEKDIIFEVIVANSCSSLRQKINSALSRDKSIDGIFGLSEQAVILALQIKRSLSTVNKESTALTIVGFCNQYQSEYDPSLIVINQNEEEIGSHAAKLILRRIKKTAVKEFQTKTIAVELN
jgi:LacI family transcriptional regulator